MSHKQQVQFCKQVRRKFPHFFRNKIVVDVGSCDINGTNRRFFSRSCHYVGIDLQEGKNVDVVGYAHKVLPMVNERIVRMFEDRYHHRINYDHVVERPISTIISTEALEHDFHWVQTLLAMYDHVRPGGLLLITAAGVGRAEHGTFEHHAWTSPSTNHYYRNISNEMFGSILTPGMFEVYHLAQDKVNFDLQFYGIKKPYDSSYQGKIKLTA